MQASDPWAPASKLELNERTEIVHRSQCLPSVLPNLLEDGHFTAKSGKRSSEE
jgi:hypothetical protein